MDTLLIINGVFLCYLTFTLYNFKLYAWNTSRNLMLCVFLFWFAFFIYDSNKDIIFIQKIIVTPNNNPKTETPKGEKTSENSWEVV